MIFRGRGSGSCAAAAREFLMAPLADVNMLVQTVAKPAWGSLMSQIARELTPHRSPRHFFGAELRHWRVLRGLAQADLAGRAYVSGDLIAKIEKALRWPTASLAANCDVILNTGGVLARLWALVDHERRGYPTSDPVAVDSEEKLEMIIASALPNSELCPASHESGSLTLRLPAGHTLPAAALTVDLRAAAIENADIASIRPGRSPSASLPGRQRLLVVEEAVDSEVGFNIADGCRKTVNRAYRLDDLSIGILWAVCGTDEALLGDDTALAESRRLVRPYEQLHGSAVSREAIRDLSAVSQMWLGSDFCARYIWRAVANFGDVPVFWTREQRGEEAATWLLYRHKYRYLRLTSGRFGSPARALVRVFCIPESAVAASPRAERVLMLLAAALMESFGVAVHVVIEPEYQAVEGFVLERGRRVVVANWVRGHGLWHVDASDRPSSDVCEAAFHGQEHSVIGAADPAGRLMALADYLGVDWSWFRDRCAELAAAGVEGLIRPRSRFVGTAGLDQACRFAGTLR